MKLVFMGTPDFAAAALRALHASDHTVVAVYTQPPRPAGRGKALRKSDVHVTAEELGLPVYTPATLKDDDTLSALRAHGADVGVVAAYGLILPQAVLDIVPKGCLNIHASLLPRWRGAAPIHRAIMAGDPETGVTIMQMDAGLDTGPMLMTNTTPITAYVTTPVLHDTLRDMGAKMIVAALDDLAAGTLSATPQPDKGATYAKKIDKAEAKIDWTKPATEIDRQVRAMTPFPGAWLELDGIRVKVHSAVIEPGQGEPGRILDESFLVATGENAIRIMDVQPAGKGLMDAEAFLRGRPNPVGVIL